MENISWLSLNYDKSGSFTYSSEVDDTIYVRACNGSNCSGASNGKQLELIQHHQIFGVMEVVHI